jgi:hypothetical protein
LPPPVASLPGAELTQQKAAIDASRRRPSVTMIRQVFAVPVADLPRIFAGTHCVWVWGGSGLNGRAIRGDDV